MTTLADTRQSGQAQPSQAAPFLRQVAAQIRAELLLTARRGENVLVTLILPVILLVIFASLRILPVSAGAAIDFLLPGVLALAIMATGIVHLGISTAYDRYYGVLKRLGATPFPRSGLIAAKIVAVLVLEVVQVILLVAIALLFYGWRPVGSPGLAMLVLALGTITCAALGLAMAGSLRAETTLAVANGLYLLFLLIGGGILPLDHLPAPLAALAPYLPAAAFTQSLRAALSAGAPFPASSLLVLVIWMLLLLGLALTTFKWE
jgi:ABC-2 type transport system permease protein